MIFSTNFIKFVHISIHMNFIKVMVKVYMVKKAFQRVKLPFYDLIDFFFEEVNAWNINKNFVELLINFI